MPLPASTLRVDEVDYNLLSNIYEYVKNNSKMLSAILTKLNELPEGKDVEDKEEQKKKMEDIFEKRGVGKPRGTSRKCKSNILKW